jgi:Tol biopolymer transport system component
VAQRAGESVGGRPWLRAWLVAGLALWLTVAIVLVDWAQRNGLVQDISFSPYHLPGYAALLVLAIYVLLRLVRNGPRHGWRGALPEHYGGLGLGLLLIAGWVVLDIAWRNTLGIEFGIENGIAPPRLLLPAALIVIAAGPVREALAARAADHRHSLDRRMAWAGALATGVIGGALTLTAFNPLRDGYQDVRVSPARDVSEIWSMAADGSDQRRVVQAHGDGVDFSLPVFAPRGDRIAYTVWTNEGGAAMNIRNIDQTAAVWTAAADGSDPRVLVDGAPDQAWTPAWSPDGKWIAYTLTPQDAPTAGAGQPQPNSAPGQLGPASIRGSGEIWIVAADGTSPPRRLSQVREDVVAATWSPDGSQLAFESSEGGDSDIHVATVTPDGLANERAIASNPGKDWGPSWSPDGRSIVFVSDRSGNEEIWTTASDGTGEPRQLTDNVAGDWVPAFSPDGTRIAFVSDRTGDSEVWTMAPDGSDARNVTQHPGYLDGQWSVAWSPDGSRLVYAMAPFQPAESSFLVRTDYAAAQALLFGISLAIVAILLAVLSAPFGAYAVVLVLIVGLSVAATGQWGYVPAAVVAGLLVDLLVRSVPPRRRLMAAATALPAAGILALGVTLAASNVLAWSITLLLGVATATALAGWGLAYAVERLFHPGAGATAPATSEA